MSFEDALILARITFGENIIYDPRVISILNDYGAFKDQPYFRHILKALISNANFSQYSLFSINEKRRFLSMFVNSYGFSENHVNTILRILFPTNNRITSSDVIVPRSELDVNTELIILIDYSKESAKASQSIDFFLTELFKKLDNRFHIRIIYYNEAIELGHINNNSYGTMDMVYTRQGSNDIVCACKFLSCISINWLKQKFKPIILWLTASEPLQEISQDFISSQLNNILFNYSNRIVTYFGISIDKLKLESFASNIEYIFHSLDINKVVNVINAIRNDYIFNIEDKDQQMRFRLVINNMVDYSNLSRLENERWKELSNGFAAVRKCDRWGWINLNGSEIIPCQFKHIRPFKEGLAAVSLCGFEGKPLSQLYKWTFINILGREITETKYEDVHDFLAGIALVCRNSLWGAIDIKGNEVIRCQYNTITYISERVLKVGINRQTSNSAASELLYGYIDFRGNIICPPEYNAVSDYFCNGYAIVQKEDKIYIINENGSIVANIPYHRAVFLGNKGLIKVLHSFYSNNKQVGVVSIDGVEVIQAKYDDIYFCRNLINITDNNWTECTYFGDKIRQYIKIPIPEQSENFIVAESNKSCTLFNCFGKEIISEKYDRIVHHYEIIIAIRDDNYFLYTCDGVRLINKVFDRVLPYKNNLIVREISTTDFFMVNKKGNTFPITNSHCKYTNNDGELVSVKYDNIVYAFENGKLLINLPRKSELQSRIYAIIDRDGILCQFFRSFFDLKIHAILQNIILQIEEIEPSDEFGRDFWKHADHYMHFIDLNSGVRLFRSKYTNTYYPKPNLSNYSENFLPIDMTKYDPYYSLKDNKYTVGIINVNTGEMLRHIDSKGDRQTIAFQDIGPMTEGLACVKYADKYGYINTTGKVVIPIQYDWASSFDHGFAIVRTENNLFKINKRGEVLCKFSYDGIKFIQFGR